MKNLGSLYFRRSRVFRVTGIGVLLAVIGILPSCGGGDGTMAPATPVDPLTPTFANGGVNEEPRLFPTLTVDAAFTSSTTQTSFEFQIECTVVIPDVPTWTGRVIVRSGVAPLTYTMTGAPLGMTINSATGALSYLAPNCTESGTNKVAVFTVTDRDGRVTNPQMRQTFKVIARI